MPRYKVSLSLLLEVAIASEVLPYIRRIVSQTDNIYAGYTFR